LIVSNICCDYTKASGKQKARVQTVNKDERHKRHDGIIEEVCSRRMLQHASISSN